MGAGRSYEQITEDLKYRCQVSTPGEILASLANVPKPASLFGQGNYRIYTAGQEEWYKKAFQEWQRMNLRW
jgi:hypothetical protein